MNTTRLNLTALFLSASLLSACGGDSDSDSGQSTADAGVSDASAGDASTADASTADASTADASTADAASPDSGDDSCTGGTITSLSGTILDPAGNPASGAKAQVCLENSAGVLVCLTPREVEADGSYTASVRSSLSCSDRVALRALTTTDQPASYYELPVALLTGEVTLSEPETIYTADAATTAGADASLEITLADGSVFSPNTDVFYPLRTGATFAEVQAHKLSATEPLPLGVTAGTYDGMIAFAPEGNLQAAAGAAGDEDNRFRLNVGTAAAGGTVNVWVQGGLSCERAGEKIEEGVWQQLTTTPLPVSAEGFVELSLPCLNWVAWKAAE